jgi:serine/threonine-protein kinase
MLKSPHAVRVLDLEETPGGELYIVMEFLAGEELSQMLQREKRLSPERAAEIARQTLEALGEAHALGVIHRDMKPHNIFICRDDYGSEMVKVLDFGIAKVAGTEDGKGLSETTRLTAPGGVLGTPSYMSPEQCRGEAITPASDFYSLGIVLYELVTGKPPFDDPNAVQVLMLHNTAPLPPLPAEIARTALGRAITQALEKNPRSRFQTAAEFTAALDPNSVLPAAKTAAISGPAIPAVNPNPRPPVQVPLPNPRPRKVPRSAWSGLRPYLIALVILILLGLLVLSHYLS